MDALALTFRRGYGLPVTVNPVTDLGRSDNLARRRPNPIAGAFFASAHSCYGGCAWDTFGCAGCQVPVGQPAYSCHPNSLGRERWQFQPQLGMSPMHTRNPLAHAAALRAIALAALRADSSLSVRLARYNAAMAKVRALEAQGVDHAAS